MSQVRTALPDRVVTIAATQRTGSNLLCRALAATGLFGFPREHLLPERMAIGTSAWGVPQPTLLGQAGQRWRKLLGDPNWSWTQRLRKDSVRDYLLRVAAEHAGASGTLCWKAMWDHYRVVLLSRGLDVAVWQAPVVWVRLRRLDRVRQAVSFARAIQSEQWTGLQPAGSAPVYDPDLIRRCEASIASQEAGWDAYFRRIGVNPIELTYESLADDHDGVVRSLLDALGHHDVPVPPQQLSRQADVRSEEWVAWYVAHSDARRRD